MILSATKNCYNLDSPLNGINAIAEKEIMILFFNKVYKNLLRLCLYSEGFNANVLNEFLRIPYRICETIFQVLDKRQRGYLSKRDFSEGLYILYYGNIEEKIKMQFGILDFDSDGVINFDDVILFLTHLIQNPAEFGIIRNSLENAFQFATSLDFGNFMETICKRKSDLFAIFYFYIIQLRPFNDNQVNYSAAHSRIFEIGIRNLQRKKEQITLAPISEALFEFLLAKKKKYQEEELDLSVLDAFETELSKTISAKFSSQITLGKNSLESNQLADFFRSRTQSRKGDEINISSRKEKHDEDTIAHFQNSLWCAEQIYKMYNLNINCWSLQTPNSEAASSWKEIFLYKKYLYTLKKFKLIAVDDSLFLFKLDSRKTYELHSIIFIRSCFFEHCEKLVPLVNENETLYSFNIVSNYEGNRIELTFAGENKEEITLFLSHLQLDTSCRSIEDVYTFTEPMNHQQLVHGVNKHTNEKVLIKIIPKDNYGTKEIKNEVDAFHYLIHSDHPGLIKHKDIVETLDCYYLIYEHHSFVTFKWFLEKKNHKLTPLEVISIASQVGDTLKYLHMNGIVCKNLLESIGIDETCPGDIRVKIINVPLTVTKSEQKFWDFYGFPELAPQEVSRDVFVNLKIDALSLAVVFYLLKKSISPLSDFLSFKKYVYEFLLRNVNHSRNASFIEIMVDNFICDV